MSTIGGQGQVGSYLDYLNSLTGYNQPQGTFPAQSNGPQPINWTGDGNPNAPAADPAQAGANGQPKTNTGQQVANGLNTVKNGYDTYQQIASNQAAQQGAQQAAVTSAAPVASAAVPAAQVGAYVPVASQAAPAGLEATGSALGLSGDGITGGMSVANSSAVPASAAASSSAPTVLGSTTAGAALPALGMMAGAYTGYQQYQGVKDASKGEDLSLTQQAALALPTFGASLVYNPIKNWGEKQGWWSFGNKDHKERDQYRGAAQKSGWLDKNNLINLEDGTKLDIGVDGREKFANAAGVKRHGYEIDHDDPLAAQGIGWLQPLGALLGQGDDKMTSDFTGELFNQLTKNGDVKDLSALRAKVVQLYNHFKLKPSELGKLFSEMDLPPEKRDAYLAAIDNLRPGRDNQLKPGEKAGVVAPKEEGKTDIKIGPKDNNVKPKAMGDGAIKPRDPRVVMRNASR